MGCVAIIASIVVALTAARWILGMALVHWLDGIDDPTGLDER